MLKVSNYSSKGWRSHFKHPLFLLIKGPSLLLIERPTGLAMGGFMWPIVQTLCILDPDRPSPSFGYLIELGV